MYVYANNTYIRVRKQHICTYTQTTHMYVYANNTYVRVRKPRHASKITYVRIRKHLQCMHTYIHTYEGFVRTHNARAWDHSNCFCMHTYIHTYIHTFIQLQVVSKHKMQKDWQDNKKSELWGYDVKERPCGDPVCACMSVLVYAIYVFEISLREFETF